MKKVVSIFFLLIIGLSAIKAQDAYVLTLDESILIAKSQSYTMQNLREDLKIAEYNLKSATSKLKTHIDMRFTLPQYDDEIKQWKDSTGVSFYPSRMLTYEGGLSINQPLPTDGRIYLEAGLNSYDDFTNNARSSSLSTLIGFSQPVDIIYGYSSIKTTLKKAELNFERSNKSLKRAELRLVYQVTDEYYRLLSMQRQTEIAYLDLERQTEAYEISKNKYAAGLIREVDALQMEVEQAGAQNSYDIAVLEQNSALKNFKMLIGLDLNENIVLDSNLKYKTVFVDPDIAVQYALDNRLEIREYEIQLEEQKLNIKQQKVYGRVRGNINAYVRKVGISNPSSDYNLFGSIGDSYHKFVDFSDSRRPNYGIGFTVTVPILDWGENKALVRAAEARMKQTMLGQENQMRSIETEVRNLVDKLNNNLKRLQLLEKNVTVAEKSFDITLQRFSDGDIDSQALALERNRLNNAYLSHLSAYTNYQLALADLMQKTFYDFQNGQLIE
ncbi:TolC family protein [Paludibacter sp. 221]|uniref:TolC family protein n=1 Tax=Paludibacter sp. 221 TaxID=2302939 RepID=UPI0013D8D5F6|nr:TolC family protein [Paludibacter sp. 221]NDV47764.1 TolC family protein [Paludibacter sp. 221]